jgi:hypothetical protein
MCGVAALGQGAIIVDLLGFFTVFAVIRLKAGQTAKRGSGIL